MLERGGGIILRGDKSATLIIYCNLWNNEAIVRYLKHSVVRYTHTHTPTPGFKANMVDGRSRGFSIDASGDYLCY